MLVYRSVNVYGFLWLVALGYIYTTYGKISPPICTEPVVRVSIPFQRAIVDGYRLELLRAGTRWN